jgi:hypothetical protein
MTEQDTAELTAAVSKMLSSFISQPSSGRVDAFVDAVERFCARCAAEAARELSHTMKRTPVPADLVEAAKDYQASDRHEAHMGDRKAIGRSGAELFWRTEAPPIVERVAPGLGNYIAAHMWWLEVTPTVDAVTDEIEQHREVWVGGARAYLKTRNTAEETERMYAMARRNAMYPCEFWTQDEFDQMTVGNFRGWVEAGR